MAYNVSIVSGTYKRLPQLIKMVDSVRRSVHGLSYEIILVGVDTDKDTAQWAKQQPDVVWLAHKGLQGAIAAVRDGVALAKGDYVVLSNDDLEFVEDAIAHAYRFMLNSANVGIGCFYTDRGSKTLHVAKMPAHTADGQMTSIHYNGVVIAARWFGNELGWWDLPGARTYGGDCAFCAKAIEAGWDVVPIEGASIREDTTWDELRAINNPPSSDNHPDTQAYLKIYPRGPEVGRKRSLFGPQDWRPAPANLPLRILYAPIYESNHKAQHEQKRGLRRALQRVGTVKEIDYSATGTDAIVKSAETWRPDWVVTQLHDGTTFTPDHVRRLREIVPGARLINWNGDVYDRSYDSTYIEVLRYFDVQGVVNADAMLLYRAKGINAQYWQIGYEPDGVGHEPDADTPRYDIVFQGNGYSEQRQHFGAFLRQLPYNVGLYGEHWQGAVKGATLYDFRAGCKLYRASTVALSDNQWTTNATGFVSNRLLQIMAAGGTLALQQEFDGMEEWLGFHNGVHLVTWSDYNDLQDKLAYWLHAKQEKERAKIARAGQLECLRNHSFENRVAQLIGWLDHLPKFDPLNADPTLAQFHEVRHG